MRHDPGPAFRALHKPGNPFILANAWDVGSARVLAGLGAEAIGTTSAGFAFTRGLPDGARISLEEALIHSADLVAATNLPVSGDLENGYADAPDGVAQTVRLACEAGLAGASIEDIRLPGAEAYDFDLAVERIKAAAAEARALPRDFVLLARADGVMTGAYDLDEAIRRIQAFEVAGADAVYIPVLPDASAVKRVCSSVSVPVNVLAVGAVAQMGRDAIGEAGAARISLGSALARATHSVLVSAATAMLETGSFGEISDTVPGSRIDELLKCGARG